MTFMILYRYNAGVPSGYTQGRSSNFYATVYNNVYMPLATVPLGTETASAAPLFRDSFQLTNQPANFPRVAPASGGGCENEMKKRGVKLPMIVVWIVCSRCALRGWKEIGIVRLDKG